LIGKYKDNKLVTNFLSLFSLKVVRFILPLMTFPYLIRVLGADKFGLIVFVQTFILYFSIFIEYGFELSATKEISVNRDDYKKVSEILSSIIFAKIFLLIISFIIFMSIIFSFEKFTVDINLYLIAFVSLIGQMLTPTYLFQGMEKMSLLSYISIGSGILYTASIFLFIEQVNDYYLVLVIASFVSIFTGLILLLVGLMKFNVQLKFVSFSSIWQRLKDGWEIFIGIIGFSFSSANVILFLGFFTNNTIVGYYAGVDKLVKALAQLLGPLAQAIYPHLSKMYEEDKNKAYNFSVKTTFYASSFIFILSIFIYVFSESVIYYILGEKFMNSTVFTTLNILLIYPFLSIAYHIYGTQNMVLNNFQKPYMYIVISSFIITTILGIVLIKYYSYTGAAIMSVLTILIPVVSMFIYLKRNFKEQK